MGWKKTVARLKEKIPSLRQTIVSLRRIELGINMQYIIYCICNADTIATKFSIKITEDVSDAEETPCAQLRSRLSRSAFKICPELCPVRSADLLRVWLGGLIETMIREREP